MPKRSRLAKGSKMARKTRLKIPSDPIAKLRGKHVVIRGRRWFERVNGNTYHSVEVYVNGKLIGYEPFAYGYGSQFLETAKDILAENGYINYQRTKAVVPVKDVHGKVKYHTSKEGLNRQEAYRSFEEYSRKNDEKVLSFVDDVERKKDL